MMMMVEFVGCYGKWWQTVSGFKEKLESGSIEIICLVSRSGAVLLARVKHGGREIRLTLSRDSYGLRPVCDLIVKSGGLFIRRLLL